MQELRGGDKIVQVSAQNLDRVDLGSILRGNSAGRLTVARKQARACGDAALSGHNHEDLARKLCMIPGTSQTPQGPDMVFRILPDLRTLPDIVPINAV